MKAFDIGTNLDEIGIGLSTRRLPEESMASYRRRLYALSTNPPDATLKGYARTAPLQLGEFDTLVGLIELRLDSNDEPLALDPFIEITAGRIKFWHDYDAELLDFECWFNDRTNGYWLRDIKVNIDASSYFNIIRYEDTLDYLKSFNLRVQNSRGMESEVLSGGTSHKLKHGLIRDLWLNDAFNFITEKAAYDGLTEQGDFFVDKLNGVIWTYGPNTSTLNYSYRQFPFRLYWNPVRAFELADLDYDHWLYQAPEYVSPTEYGLSIIETLEEKAPQHWK